ncbi:non-homologous end-joining DNA ligase [Alkalihalobacillus trypoxylicola]|nr:non-homologous end-joining DNA ligase [Alkalihalobacillus trypoxylicola]
MISEQTFQFKKSKANYRGLFIVFHYEQKDESFLVGLHENASIIEVGSLKNGLKGEEFSSLKQVLLNNQVSKETKKEGIVVELEFSALYRQRLINPVFRAFMLEQPIQNCTWDYLLILNTSVEGVTHPEKPIWHKPVMTKEQYISKLIQISPVFLRFLSDKPVTLIRFPHGVEKEFFYQKNCPDYAPAYIKTIQIEKIDYIVCQDLKTLTWLGNQLALEFHIPFQKMNSKNPHEIVFDLDPPDYASFSLAIKAAQQMKKIFDQFSIRSFPKFSGNKGIQIHLPINDQSLSYEETRIFTFFIAQYLVNEHPDDFTIERMKNKRGKRLYIDFLQHAGGKTIIAPYSPRGNKKPLIALPLEWEELYEEVIPEDITIDYAIKRLKEKECPMSHYFEESNNPLKVFIKKLKKEWRKK